MKLETIVAENY